MREASFYMEQCSGQVGDAWSPNSSPSPGREILQVRAELLVLAMWAGGMCPSPKSVRSAGT